jgi:hypothetical protein
MIREIFLNVLLTLAITGAIGSVIWMFLGSVPYIESCVGESNPKIIDPHKKTGKYAVVFTKCVRGRFWFPPYVVGYYRWYWWANIVNWCVFNLNNGNVNTLLVDGKRVDFEET